MICCGVLSENMCNDVVFTVLPALEDDELKNNDGISFSSSIGPAWAGSERDYSYDEVGDLT